MIHGSPQVIPLAADSDKDLVQVPRVARPRPSFAELIGIRLAEFPSPIAPRFVRHDDAAFRHHLLDIPGAQAEAEVAPDTVADDLRWKTMPDTVGELQSAGIFA